MYWGQDIGTKNGHSEEAMMQKENIELPIGRTDRTWALPRRSSAMRMSWHDLLFAHWPFSPSEVDHLLPKGITADTFSGDAWVAIVPFRMTDVAPRYFPALPWMSAFPELNVRTYISIDGKPGVWFFSLDATNPLAVRIARRFFHLPYMDARISITSDSDGWYHYESRRTHRDEPSADFVAKYRPTGEPFEAEPGTLEHWLTARYCLYTADHRGRILRGEIDHEPWQLQRAEWEVRENSMFSSLSLENSFPPHLLFSKDIAVRAWWNEPVGRAAKNVIYDASYNLAKSSISSSNCW